MQDSETAISLTPQSSKIKIEIKKPGFWRSPSSYNQAITQINRVLASGN
ncbi:MAG: hypothetical protein ACBR12_07615 [Microcoleus sp.]